MTQHIYTASSLKKNVTNHRSTILLSFLLLIALGLRLFGIGFDLPNLSHPDEDAVIMPAINILKTGNWEPTRMEYGSFHIYLLTGVFATVYALETRDGRINSVDELPLYERGSLPASYPYPEYFLAARIVSALLGTLFVLIIYMFGKRLGNKQQGLIAALIAAILPALVVNDHFATTDTALMFWVAVSLYLLIRVYDNWETDSLWAYAGAGFVCGLAVSTKYNGIVLAIPLFLVPILRVKTLDELLSFRVISGPLAMAAGFLIGTPFALLNLPKFLHWFGYSLRLYNAPGQEINSPVWLWHLKYHLSSPHTPIILLSIFGFFISFRYWGVKRAIIVNSFVIALWLAILGQTNAQTRMWLPSAPLVILWSTLTVDITISKTKQFLTSRHKNSNWAYGIMLLLIIPFLYYSIRYDLNFRAGDVRNLARQWIVENIPPGSKIAIDYFHPNLNPETWNLTRTFFVYDHDYQWYVENGVEYLIVNDVLNDFSQRPPGTYDRYQTLISQVCEIGSIPGTFIATTDTEIKIYRVEPCP